MMGYDGYDDDDDDKEEPKLSTRIANAEGDSPFVGRKPKAIKK